MVGLTFSIQWYDEVHQKNWRCGFSDYDDNGFLWFESQLEKLVFSSLKMYRTEISILGDTFIPNINHQVFGAAGLDGTGVLADDG